MTGLFAALLAALSTIPGEAAPGDSAFVWLYEQTPKLVQKGLHVGLYAAFAVLLSWTLPSWVRSNRRRWVGALLMAVAFGAILEWLQTGIPGRFGSALDVAFNAAGALAGMLVLRSVQR